MPSLNNPNHVFDIYWESDSDVIYIEDFSKGEARKNSKEYDYANMDLEKEGKQADLQDLNITRYRDEITEVCHFGHFWLSYGRSAMSG